MPPTLAPLLQQYESKCKAMKSLTDGSADWTGDDYEKFEGLQKEIEGLGEQIKAARRVEELSAANEARLKELSAATLPVPLGNNAKATPQEQDGERIVDLKERRAIFEEGLKLISPKILDAISTAAYKDAFRSYLQKGKEGISSTELKALQEGLDQSGGYLVPEEMLARLIQKMPAPTRVAGLVTDIPTSRDSVTMPRVVYTTDDIYTTGIRVTATGEIPASATSHRVTEPVFGQLRIPIQTWMLSIPVTNDMIEDSIFPIMPWLEMKFSETIDLLLDNQILNGTGVNAQPRGILLNPGGTDEPQQVDIGAASAITADGLMEIAYAIPEQYLDNLRWIFNYTSTAKNIAKLKDAENRYLFSMGMQDSGIAGPRARTLLGFPPVYSAFMPNQGANALPVIFGDLRGYFLARRIGFSVQVLRELYAETNQQLLLGRLRFGGRVAEPWRMAVGRTPS